MIGLRHARVWPAREELVWDDGVMTTGPNELGSAPLASVHEFTQSMQQLVKLSNEFTECMNGTTQKLRQVKGWDNALPIVNGFADDITPIAEGYIFHANNCVAVLRGIDHDTQQELAKIKATPRDRWGNDTLRYLAGIRRLAQSNLRFINTSRVMHSRINGFMGRSPKLDQPMQRFQSAVATLIGMSEIFENWLKELGNLGS
jgi:hypothetical protein